MLCKTVELTRKISNGQWLALIAVKYVAGDDDEKWKGDMSGADWKVVRFMNIPNNPSLYDVIIQCQHIGSREYYCVPGEFRITHSIHT